jgi:CRISPR-associated protein Cmr3
MWIFIQPTDVWLFRDGRPFSAGSEHRARSLFPPTPSTMQGAVRAKVLAESGVSLWDYADKQKEPLTQRVAADIGSPNNGYGKLQLRGPMVAHAEQSGLPPTPYLPAPADVMKANKKPLVLRPLATSPFTNNLPPDGQNNLSTLWHRSPDLREGYDGLWLSANEMREYLEHEKLTLPDNVEEDRQLFDRESRFHVGIDSSIKRPRDGDAGGHLFQVEFIRPRDGVGLLLEVGTMSGGALPDFPERGLLQLGGEARSAFYEKVAAPPRIDDHTRKPALDSGQFKVVFVTPAYFADGWRPANGDWSRFFNGNSVRLVSAAFNRAQSIGGARADLKSQGEDKNRGVNFQKPIRRFIPAGSVFYFKADGPVTDTNQPVTETPQGEADFGQIGYGQILIGRWKDV